MDANSFADLFHAINVNTLKRPVVSNAINKFRNATAYDALSNYTKNASVFNPATILHATSNLFGGRERMGLYRAGGMYAGAAYGGIQGWRRRGRFRDAVRGAAVGGAVGYAGMTALSSARQLYPGLRNKIMQSNWARQPWRKAATQAANNVASPAAGPAAAQAVNNAASSATAPTIDLSAYNVENLFAPK